MKDGNPSNSAASDPVAPLLIWLAIELAALALAAFRVPLAAVYPQPAEFQAVRNMLAFQFVFATLLFPWLLRSWRIAIPAIFAGCIFLLFAAALSAWELRDVMPAIVLLSLWLVFLTAVNCICPLPRWRMVLCAIASVYVIGGPLLWYLQLDFGSGPIAATGWAYGPLLPALISPEHPMAQTKWGLVGICAVFGLICLVKSFKSDLFRRFPR